MPADLAKLFLAAHERGAKQDTSELGALQSALAKMFDEGRAAWPDLHLEAASYVRHLAARAPEANAKSLVTLRAADLFLACACANGDLESIAAFDRVLLAPLAKRLTRSGFTPELADEAVQALRERLFVAPEGGRRKISDYNGSGALDSWVRVAATRAASNLRRDRGTQATLTEPSRGSSPPVDPEMLFIQRRYGNAFQTALRDAFGAISEEERNVLRLHFTDGLNLDAIAKALGVSRATAGRRMLSGRKHVLDETMRLLQVRIASTPQELKSLLGAVRSKLELSLSALLSK